MGVKRYHGHASDKEGVLWVAPVSEFLLLSLLTSLSQRYM